MPAARHLTITAAPGQPLTPEHKRFNQLLRRLEAVRAELAAWDEPARAYAAAHAHRIRPLAQKLDAAHIALVRRLDELLGGRTRWSRGDRRLLREVLCEYASMLADDAEDPAVAAAMKALHDKHAEVDLETGKREALAGAKQMFEAMTGVDLGEVEFDDEEAFAEHARRALASEQEAQEERRAQRRPTAAQRRREREEAEATQSLREIYRKLATALHPDRAADEADRARRTELMQRANSAYEAKDLLALFALQLEIEQVDAQHLARAGAAKARQYARLLGEQIDELKAELDARRTAFCFEFGLDPEQPPKPAQLGAVLERSVRQWRADLAEAERELRDLADEARTRRWLREQKLRADSSFSF